MKLRYNKDNNKMNVNTTNMKKRPIILPIF